jgi:hypothetical protein
MAVRNTFGSFQAEAFPSAARPLRQKNPFLFGNRVLIHLQTICPPYVLLKD